MNCSICNEDPEAVDANPQAGQAQAKSGQNSSENGGSHNQNYDDDDSIFAELVRQLHQHEAQGQSHYGQFGRSESAPNMLERVRLKIAKDASFSRSSVPFQPRACRSSVCHFGIRSSPTADTDELSIQQNCDQVNQKTDRNSI